MFKNLIFHGKNIIEKGKGNFSSTLTFTHFPQRPFVQF